jgi:hypothetical protein
MMVSGRRLDFGLALACILSAAGLIYEIGAPLAAFDLPPVTPPDLPPSPTIVAFNPPPQASFAVIDARPIFNPTRQPVEATALPGNATATTPPDVVLVGVIIDAKNQLALVKREGAPFAQSVVLGASLDGWDITEIAADHVTMHAGAQEFVLGLDGKRKSQPGAPQSSQANVPGTPITSPFVRTPAKPKTAPPQATLDSGNDDQQQKANMGAQ